MAGDKKISELSQQSTLNSVSWFETIDLTETDPNLQNKRVNDATMGLHVQNTDQFLDEGGVNQVQVVDAARLINRPYSYAWVYSDTTQPSNTGFMTILAVSAGVVIVQLNSTPLGMDGIQDYFESLPIDSHLQFTFNDGGGSILVKIAIAFTTTNNVMSANCLIVNDDRLALEGKFGGLNLLPIIPAAEGVSNPFAYTTVVSPPSAGEVSYDGSSTLMIASVGKSGLDSSDMFAALPVGTFIYMTGREGGFLVKTSSSGTDLTTYFQFTTTQSSQTGSVALDDNLELTFITP